MIPKSNDLLGKIHLSLNDGLVVGRRSSVGFRDKIEEGREKETCCRIERSKGGRIN